MGWGTNYKYDGYISRVLKNELGDKYEECEKINEMMWQKILAIMAMTPQDQEDEEGGKIEWADYVGFVLRDARETIEENLRLMARISDCQETMEEHPENVYDDEELWKKSQEEQEQQEQNK